MRRISTSSPLGLCLLSLLPSIGRSFQVIQRAQHRPRHAVVVPTAVATTTTSFPPYIPAAEVQEIQEEAALDMLRALRRVDVSLGGNRPTVQSSYYHKDGDGEATSGGDEQPVVVLLHGFDSSCLEFRRLVPRLEALGVRPYAMDVLGWGFTDARALGDTSAAAKRAHLHAFWQQQLGGRPLVLVGASLGGAIAVDFAAAFPGAVQKMILIDAQGFIDGAGPMGGFPRPVARLGIKLLGSKPLRNLVRDVPFFVSSPSVRPSVRRFCEPPAGIPLLTLI